MLLLRLLTVILYYAAVTGMQLSQSSLSPTCKPLIAFCSHRPSKVTALLHVVLCGARHAWCRWSANLPDGTNKCCTVRWVQVQVRGFEHITCQISVDRRVLFCHHPRWYCNAEFVKHMDPNYSSVFKLSFTRNAASVPLLSQPLLYIVLLLACGDVNAGCSLRDKSRTCNEH